MSYEIEVRGRRSFNVSAEGRAGALLVVEMARARGDASLIRVVAPNGRRFIAAFEPGSSQADADGWIVAGEVA